METDSRRRLRTLIPLLVLATTGAMIETKASDFSIFGRHAIDTPASALAGFEGAEVRILRHDSRGLVAEVNLPIGVTVFFDPPRSTDGNALSVVRTAASDWVAGMVSARDTGIALKLQVRDLYQVPQSGQRTWLLRAGADLTLPWERHRTIEEGYLISGDYRLFECLEGREKRFDYRAGGYFYRAPGIVHGGPSSGSSGEIVMLLRTPDKLTVEFLPTCSTTANP